MLNPNKIHYQALNQIWKYLNYNVLATQSSQPPGRATPRVELSYAQTLTQICQIILILYKKIVLHW